MRAGKLKPYTTLRDAGKYVRNRQEFRGNSVHSTWIWDADPDAVPDPSVIGYPAKPMRYVVYSYGTHFPMYVWDEATRQWYGNSDKYSRTTSRHQSVCRPHDVSHWFPRNEMINIAAFGAVGHLILKVQAGVENREEI